MSLQPNTIVFESQQPVEAPELPPQTDRTALVQRMAENFPDQLKQYPQWILWKWGKWQRSRSVRLTSR
jgi:hypothetical protein